MTYKTWKISFSKIREKISLGRFWVYPAILLFWIFLKKGQNLKEFFDNVLALPGPFVIRHFKDKRLNLYHNNEIISILYQKKYIFASEKLKIFVRKKLRIFACKNNFFPVQYTNNLNNEVITHTLGFKMTYHIWF